MTAWTRGERAWQSVCRHPNGGCGAAVRFVATGRTKPDGKPVLMILDPDPVPCGNVVARDGLAVVLSKNVAAIDGEPRWKDHHATCAALAANKRVGDRR